MVIAKTIKGKGISFMENEAGWHGAAPSDSDLERALLDSKIGDVVTGSFDSGILQPSFSINVKNTNEDKKEQFINIIESEQTTTTQKEQ